MKFKLSTVTCSILCATTLVACGGTDDIIDAIIDKVLPPMPEETIVTADLNQGRVAIPLEFRDAKTGQIVQEKISLHAEDDIAQSNVYEDPTQQNIQNGYAYIYLTADAAKSASSNKPVKLRVIISADGYFTTSTDIIYTGHPISLQKISLVSKAAPPAGIAVALQKDVKTDTSGKLLKDIQLTAKTTDVASKGAAASFSLAANTILKDEKGQALIGDLKVSIGYFSPKTENIGAVFPGGLNPDQVKVFENNQWRLQQGYFVTAGLMAVDITDAQGRKAHLLSNGQGTMTIQTPAGLLNPETNLPVKDGDTIPVWSHSETTGLWQQELVGKFKQNAQGNFDVSYQVSHLSYWNLDWYYNKMCAELPLQYSQDFHVDPYLTMDIDVEGFGKYQTLYIQNSGEFTYLLNMPQDRAINFQVKYQNRLVGRGYKIPNTCGKVHIEMLEKLPATRNVPTQVYIAAPKSFTKAELSILLDNISSLSSAEKTAILKLTHPSNADAKFTINQNTLKKFMDLGVGVKEIGLIQTVLSLKVKVNGDFRGLDQFGKIYFQTLNSQGQMTLSNLPQQDIVFDAPKTIMKEKYNWYTQQTTTYPFTQIYASLGNYVKNNQGGSTYTVIPLKTATTIKKTDTQATIIFEDISALQQIMKNIKK
ncbi:MULTISPECIES: hypothetical protein [unclassified Acinetobacter]|uniref:hypothetical protein n=1 Tax=unclassified Acinetobacter TaxID=196816 RepID=UPI0025762DCA|nr:MULTISPECIES: hypothetical protein [unclassified Acinetobacter]MDM1764963.1 hypothetical protein [Acinetobacter sp. 226-1]MDM1768412.1 hypothetical protein [Acinetobacter sp. 226-4]